MTNKLILLTRKYESPRKEKYPLDNNLSFFIPLQWKLYFPCEWPSLIFRREIFYSYFYQKQLGLFVTYPIFVPTKRYSLPAKRQTWGTSLKGLKVKSIITQNIVSLFTWSCLLIEGAGVTKTSFRDVYCFYNSVG